MKLILLVLPLLLVSLTCSFSISPSEQVSAVNWPFAICGNGTWSMKNLTLSKTPARNSEDAVDAFGVANSQTEFSKVDIVVKLNGLFLHSQTVDFNRSFDQGDIIEYEYKTLIPSFAPAGTYVMSFTYKTPQGKDNGCWSFSFKL